MDGDIRNIGLYIASRSDDLLKVCLLGLLDVGPSLALSSSQDFLPLCSSGLLDFSFELFLGFSLGVSLGEDLESSEPVVGLVLNQVVLAVVNEAEADRPVSTEGGPEPEEDDVFNIPFVLGSQEFLQLGMGHVGLALVEHFQDQFLSSQQLIDAQPSGSDGDGHKLMVYYYLLILIQQSIQPADIAWLAFALPAPRAYPCLLNIHNINIMIHNEAKVATVVLDIGTYRTYAGEAGFEAPRFASHSYVVEHPSHKKSEYLAGTEALNSQNYTKEVNSVFANSGALGRVDRFHFDVDKFDRFVQTILLDNLELEDHGISLLIAQDVAVDLEPSQVIKQRQKVADYLLDGMELSNIAFVKKPVLSALAVGRTNAVVLDSGHNFTNCSIIQDGFCVYNKSLPIGGRVIDNIIQQKIESRLNGAQNWRLSMEAAPQAFKSSDLQFHKMVEMEKILKQFSQIPIDTSMADQSQSATYTLPDSSTITISRGQIVDPFVNYRQFWEKYLKDPSNELPSFMDAGFLKVAMKFRGLEQMIYDTIDQYLALLENKNKSVLPPAQVQAGRKKPNQLTQQQLLNNVILTGGNLSFSDTAWKITQGIRKRGGNVIKCPVEFNKDAEGNPCMNSNSLSWIGGSIVANLPVFNNFWIRLSEWREIGTVLSTVKATGVEQSKTQENEEQVRRSKKMELISKKCP